MKTTLYPLTVAALCLLTHFSYATIWRVNNNDGSANYASLQDAHGDANVRSGDTLMVEGSTELYNSQVTITKRLVIIGPGYFLNGNPNTQANGVEAVFFNSIQFDPGSEGSVLIGISLDNGYVTINTDRITVQRCRLTGSGLYLSSPNQVKSIIIEQCYIGNLGSNVGFDDVKLLNNIILSDVNTLSSSTRQKQFSQVENNLFLGNRLILSADVFVNNIIASTGEDIDVASNDVRNNLAANAQFGTENGNQDYNPTNDVLFFGEDGNSTDGQYRIRDDSPYKAIGTDGTEPGPFGGPNPYILSGLPPIPVVYELRTEGVGNQEAGLPVTIKVKSY